MLKVKARLAVIRLKGLQIIKTQSTCVKARNNAPLGEFGHALHKGALGEYVKREDAPRTLTSCDSNTATMRPIYNVTSRHTAA